jgi:hypothetical protein
MKQLHIQIQPARFPGLDLTAAIDCLSRLSTEARVGRGEDHGEYVNIDYETSRLAELWILVRAELLALPGLADATIVTCEGKFGWDDYLLLHHFDPTEPLDECR